MADKKRWWMLDRGDGWCMPPGTTWSTGPLWEYAERHGIARQAWGEKRDAYLRSVGAVPIAEMCDRAEAAEKSARYMEWAAAEMASDRDDLVQLVSQLQSDFVQECDRAEAAEAERDQLREAVGLLQHMDEVLDAFSPYLVLHSHLWTPKALLVTVRLAVAKVFLKLEEIGLVHDAKRTKEWGEAVIGGETTRAEAVEADAERLASAIQRVVDRHPNWHAHLSCGCEREYIAALAAHAKLKAKNGEAR